MMHIIDISCISPQETYGTESFRKTIIPHSGNEYLAIEPDYKSFISRGALRRMSKATRFGIAAGHPLIQNHSSIKGIILSTGNGSMSASSQFLNQIIQYQEGALTPTQFVNSTANSVGGTLALIRKNTGYNATYVQHGFGFEMALLDAMMQLENEVNSKILIGNVDEISDANTNIELKRGSFKTEETNYQNLLQSTSKGTVVGEGSAMFVVSNSAQNKLATVLDVGMIQSQNKDEVAESILQFLAKNNLQETDIDTLILGFNGDGEGDAFYHNVLDKVFSNQTVLSFKNLVGDYPTVSGFALWMASQKGGIPNEAVFKNGKKHCKNILIYNHYQNEQHGFILVENEELIINS